MLSEEWYEYDYLPGHPPLVLTPWQFYAVVDNLQRWCGADAVDKFRAMVRRQQRLDIAVDLRESMPAASLEAGCGVARMRACRELRATRGSRI